MINAAIRAYDWPLGVRIQTLVDSNIEGDRAGFPKNESSLPFTAHQMMVVAVHSITLLSQFVPSAFMDSDVWQCWVLHQQCKLQNPAHSFLRLTQPPVRLADFCMCLSSSFTLEDVRRLDSLIYRQQIIFLRIPECYDLWVPKHHFATHFPFDILLWGPLIRYWCMLFEMEVS
eukprot:5213290-Prymnesium_polylepis.1